MEKIWATGRGSRSENASNISSIFETKQKTESALEIQSKLVIGPLIVIIIRYVLISKMSLVCLCPILLCLVRWPVLMPCTIGRHPEPQ